MSRIEFDETVAGLGAHILASVKQFFALRSVEFDAEAFLEDSTVNIEDIAKEALFHGAEIFPVDIPTQ